MFGRIDLGKRFGWVWGSGLQEFWVFGIGRVNQKRYEFLVVYFFGLYRFFILWVGVGWGGLGLVFEGVGFLFFSGGFFCFFQYFSILQVVVSWLMDEEQVCYFFLGSFRICIVKYRIGEVSSLFGIYWSRRLRVVIFVWGIRSFLGGVGFFVIKREDRLGICEKLFFQERRQGNGSWCIVFRSVAVRIGEFGFIGMCGFFIVVFVRVLVCIGLEIFVCFQNVLFLEQRQIDRQIEGNSICFSVYRVIECRYF